MKIHLHYGKQGLDIEMSSSDVTIIEPVFREGFSDEPAEFQKAVHNPIASRPIKALIKSSDKVAIVIADITRPLPSERLLSWLFEELSHVPVDNFTIIIGTGSHRASTEEEIVSMVGPRIADNYCIINHNSYSKDTLDSVGKTQDGKPVLMNKEYVRADKRIVLGFIEPHFFAGYSGGYKGIFPGIVDIESIMHYHRASVIGDSRSTWGTLEGNPTQEHIRDNGALLPVDFCINVTLNNKKQITGFFCGDVISAHERGCEFVKSMAMIACDHVFPIVITTNGGYPLDQNLYQTVKGISAAAQIVANGGLIITASKCNDGFPDYGNFRKLLHDHASAKEVLDVVMKPGFSMHDQWEAQKLAMILVRARVGLYSDISQEEIQKAHIIPVQDISLFVDKELKRIGSKVPIAVLPEGPMTIPYI